MDPWSDLFRFGIDRDINTGKMTFLDIFKIALVILIFPITYTPLIAQDQDKHPNESKYTAKIEKDLLSRGLENSKVNKIVYPLTQEDLRFFADNPDTIQYTGSLTTEQWIIGIAWMTFGVLYLIL